MIEDLKAVIFDLDGTLVDSMWLWTHIDIEFLGKRNLQLPDDLQKAIEGMSFTETAIYFKERFDLHESIEDIKSEWNEMAHEFYQNQVHPKEGVMDYLDWLKENDIKIGLGTSNSKEMAEEVLKSRDLLKYFDSIRTSCEVSQGKPAPDIFLKVAEDLTVNPKNCLVFEDTYAGVQAGKSAGMKVIAIRDEFSYPYEKEIRELADGYVSNFVDVLPLIKEIFIKEKAAKKIRCMF